MKIKKALVVNPFGIGDVLFTLHIVEALHLAQPGIQIDFLCNERTEELVRMSPQISNIYVFNRDHLRAQRKNNFLAPLVKYADLVQSWRAARYDAMLDYSLGREFSFLAQLAGIPVRAGLSYRHRGAFLSHKIKFSGYEGMPVVRKQLELLPLLGVQPFFKSPKLNISMGFAARASKILAGLKHKKRHWIAVAPGGGRSWGIHAVYKQWDPAKFAETASWWSENHDADVLLLGDALETKLLEEVRSRIRAECIVVAGEPLPVVGHLLKACQILCCNDGGLMHFANTLGVKVVSMYGPVDEVAYGPACRETQFQVLSAPVACRPCYKQFHFPPCEHHRQCLEKISVEMAIEAMEKIV